MALSIRGAAWSIGFAAIWMTPALRPAWSQWTGGSTGPIYYNGVNVGIGTASPGSGTLLTPQIDFANSLDVEGPIRSQTPPAKRVA